MHAVATKHTGYIIIPRYNDPITNSNGTYIRYCKFLKKIYVLNVSVNNMFASEPWAFAFLVISERIIILLYKMSRDPDANLIAI